MFTAVKKAASTISSALLAVIFGVFVASVIMRYFLNTPLPWADELSVILFGILIFFASALAMKPSEQICFEVVYDLLPAAAARAVYVASSVVFGGILLAAFWPCLDYVLFMFRQRTPALNIPYFYVFVAFPFFLLAVSMRMIWSGISVALGRAQPE